MILASEIEIAARKILDESAISVRVVNPATVRIELERNSFIDIFQSLKDPHKFAFHAKLSDGRIYRIDCQPERKYKKLKSFPWHLHDGSDNTVISSPFSIRRTLAFLQFLRFIHNKIEGIV